MEGHFVGHFTALSTITNPENYIFVYIFSRFSGEFSIGNKRHKFDPIFVKNIRISILLYF